jgi:tetratricopeptide (TPR) repeat protein
MKHLYIFALFTTWLGFAQSIEKQIDMGRNALLKGDYKTAKNYFSQAEQLVLNQKETKENLDFLGTIYGNLGIIVVENSNYVAALAYQHKAKNCFEKSNNKEKLARTLNNIGISYQSMHLIKASNVYFEKSYDLQLQTKDVNIGTTATNLAFNALKTNLVEAKNWLDKAAKAFKENPNPRGEGEMNNVLGQYYLAENNPSKALEVLQKALTIFNASDDVFGKSDTHYFLGNCYEKMNETQKAKSEYETSAQLSNQLGATERQAAATEKLATIYENEKNFQQALSYQKQFQKLKFQLNEQNNHLKLSLLELKSKNHEAQVINEKNETRKNLIFGFLAGFIILAAIFWYFYNQQRLQKRTLKLQKELSEYEQKALHLQMNPHFVFNCLAAISAFILQNGKEEAILYLSKFSKLMRLTLDYSKSSLITIDKEIEGLTNYLELEKLRFNHIFDYEIIKDKAIEDDFAIPPLMIQPLAENAIIHGMVPNKDVKGKLVISFLVKNETLICTIQDNGIGIKASKTRKDQSVYTHQSMALEIIQKRLLKITDLDQQKSSLKIEELTQNATGTLVTLTMPLQYSNDKILTL